MKIVTDSIFLQELKTIAEKSFGQLVKAVVDIDKEIMLVGGDLHSDQEKILLENGSRQQDLWGINLYPFLPENQRIEYDSMINLRPAQGNLTRGINDSQIRQRISAIIARLVKK